MFSHVCSNMMMRGDGKSHIFHGDCFSSELKNKVKDFKPTRGFLNPPYQDGNAKEQLEFIENTLECLEKDGICVAICQMSTAVSLDKKVAEVKKRLLDKHTLLGVFSMPDELFHPIGVNTCILVFKAYTPNNKNSFFGYFKNDGFEKRKNKGRLDIHNQWNGIKENWLELYDKKEDSFISIHKKIVYTMEWCAECHIETDCSILSKDIFAKELKKYVAFNMFNFDTDTDRSSIISNEMILDIDSLQYVKINTIFEITGSKTTPLQKLKEYGVGPHPYVTTQATNNGTRGFYNYYTEDGNILTIDSAVVGYCSYQPHKFSASDHVEKLIPKFKMNKWIALFLLTVINLEQHRFSYGRKASQTRLKELSIKLPVDSNGNPDWKYMENYIKTLPYSSSI